MRERYAYPQMVNLAILIPSEAFPSYANGTLDMYWKRSNEVNLINPIKYSDFLEKNKNNISGNKSTYLSYVNKIYYNHHLNTILLNGKEINYTKTAFSDFDEFLLNQYHYKFTE